MPCVFLLSGLTFYFAVVKSSVYIESILAALILALGLVAFTGYLIGVDTSMGVGKLTRMAIHTSFSFILIAIGLFVKSIIHAINQQQSSFSWLCIPIAITGVTLTALLSRSIAMHQVSILANDKLFVTTYAAEAILVFGISFTGLLCYILYAKTRLDDKQQNRIAVYSTIYLGAVLSFSIYQINEEDIQQDILQEFKTRAEKRVRALELSFLPYYETLYTIQTGFHAAEQVSREEFKQLVWRSVHSYDGVIAMEWLPKLKHEQRSEYEQKAKDDGLTDFQIFEMNDGRLLTAQTKDVYYPVYYAEPMGLNRSAVGFDVSSVEHVAYALQQSLFNNSPFMSNRLSLIKTGANGILIALPVYNNRLPRNSIDQRIDALIGYAMTVIDVGLMVESTLDKYTEVSGIHIVFRDLDNEGEVLYTHHSRLDSAIPLDQLQNETGLVYQTTQLIGGKNWGFELIAADPDQYSVKPTDIITIPIFVFILSCALAYYLTISLKKQREKEQLIKYQSALLDAIPNPVVVKDNELNIKAVNKSFERFFGIQRQHIVGESLINIEFLPEQIRNTFYVEDTLLLQKGGSSANNIQVTLADNQEHDIFYQRSSFAIDDQIQGVIGVAVDVSAQVREKRQTEAIFNNLTDGIGLLGENGFIQANPALVALYGLSDESALLGLLPDDPKLSPKFQSDGEPSNALVADLILATHQEQRVEKFEWLHKANIRIDHDWLAEITLIPVEHNAQPALICIVRDIDQQRRAALAVEKKPRSTQSQSVISQNWWLGIR